MKFWQNNLCEKTKFQFFKLFCVMTAESERSRIITALHRYERARANGSGLRSHHCVRTHGYMTRELLVEIGTTFSLPNLKGRLNTDTSPQNFWTTFLANNLTEKFKKSAVASAIVIPLPLWFSCFVPLRRFRENLSKPFYFYLSRTCDSPGGTPSVISLALKRLAYATWVILFLSTKFFDNSEVK